MNIKQNYKFSVKVIVKSRLELFNANDNNLELDVNIFKNWSLHCLTLDKCSECIAMNLMVYRTESELD